MARSLVKTVFYLCCAVTLVITFRAFFSDYRVPESKSKSQAEKDVEDIDFISVPIQVIMAGYPIELLQDDPHIKKYILNHGYLEKPSLEPYNLTSSKVNPSMGQEQLIQKLFQNQRGLFFVESGGLDGETRSNTLSLEKELGWKGLLVEADPSNYYKMMQKRRKSWISNSCLATMPYPHKVIFEQNFNIGKISNESSKGFSNTIKTLKTNKKTKTEKKYSIVQCFPLYSLLNAISVATVDYFSLDVEGAELDVLTNIPFDKIFIKTLSVEFSHIPKGKEALQKFMEGNGYVKVAEVKNKKGLANDFIFVHESLKSMIELANTLSLKKP